MSLRNMGRIVAENHPLFRLIQTENFCGWVYNIDYDWALVMTNDKWKAEALGIPHNSFLIACAFDASADGANNFDPTDAEVILLRVVGSCRLPQDDDNVRTKIDNFQEQASPTIDEGMDDITQSRMQFGGLQCRVLGTFYMDKNSNLRMGSDLESFASAARLKVYRPRTKALEIIVNYVDPIRKAVAEEEAKALGIKGSIQPIQLGTVRYTSTDRLHRGSDDEKVPVAIQPSDFLARRTAVLGMTRTGKSNMVKQTVAVVKRVSLQGGLKIGQIIFDLNGEYANANQQDNGSIADVYPDDTVRYRMLPAEGFNELRNNFYEQVTEGFEIIKREMALAGRTSGYITVFHGLSFDQPEEKNSSEFKRWQVRLAVYKCLLFRAGFKPPENHRVYFDANATIRQAVNNIAGVDLGNPSNGFSLEEAVEWFRNAVAENAQKPLMSSSSKKPWIDDTLKVLLDMLFQQQNGSYINGWRDLVAIEPYHSPRRSGDVSTEVYEYLKKGHIVILDLSVGDPTLREKISKSIAQRIFDQNMKVFVEGKFPPNIVVYIEEAHNLIGKNLELTETWPRLAKEGAKYRIGLVYATQEVSSVHPNILSNTENWFISHLNNAREVKELAQFYDFEDFSRSIVRAQDVGFARVKTLSSPFVTPVQIDKFDPETEKERVRSISG
ncbi:MAG: DUF87 domain-containing protein [Capsulimonadales bacterium]|nr:DUF87 domain-containing protein [Capsulimonadales bacterium]